MISLSHTWGDTQKIHPSDSVYSNSAGVMMIRLIITLMESCPTQAKQDLVTWWRLDLCRNHRSSMELPPWSLVNPTCIGCDARKSAIAFMATGGN